MAKNQPEPAPSTLGINGRDASGKFVAGNREGRGNPLAGRAAKIRAILLEAMTDQRAEALARTLLIMAIKDRDLAAIKELLDRTIGRPCTSELKDRIEVLEATLGIKSDSDFVQGDPSDE